MVEAQRAAFGGGERSFGVAENFHAVAVDRAIQT